MRGWNFETSLKTCIAKLKFLYVLLCTIKARLVYRFRAFICCLSMSEKFITFINVSISDQQDFIITRNVGNYVVILMSRVN